MPEFFDPICQRCGSNVMLNYGDGLPRHMDHRLTKRCNSKPIVVVERHN